MNIDYSKLDDWQKAEVRLTWALNRYFIKTCEEYNDIELTRIAELCITKPLEPRYHDIKYLQLYCLWSDRLNKLKKNNK